LGRGSVNDPGEKRSGPSDLIVDREDDFLLGGQGLKQVRDQNILLRVMAERELRVDIVDVSAATLAARNVARRLKVRNYLVGRTLCDPDEIGDLSRGAVRIMVDIIQHQSVIRNEGPLWRSRQRRGPHILRLWPILAQEVMLINLVLLAYGPYSRVSDNARTRATNVRTGTPVDPFGL